MTKVNAAMSAEQFFWKQIDKDGSGKLETIFEINEAESRGFSAKIGMTQEEFVAKNKKAIQKRANSDIEYSSYQLEQAKKSSEQEIEKKISKMKKCISKFAGEKPAMGIESSSGTEVKKSETKDRSKSLYKVELPTAEDLSKVPDNEKEQAKAEYIKIFINHKKYPEEGGRKAILPNKLEEYVKQAEEEFEAKWQASRELLN